MNDPKILVLISKHISNSETIEEKNEFTSWLSENKENVIVFEKIKNTWLGIEQNQRHLLKDLIEVI